MNRQRKVVITTTYNEMGIIIDTKAEEVPQPDLQPTCNNFATDLISRQAAIDAVENGCQEWKGIFQRCEANINNLPSAQQKIIHCADCNYRNKYRFPPKYDERDYCEKHEKVVQTDWYCSWAERRQE